MANMGVKFTTEDAILGIYLHTRGWRYIFCEYIGSKKFRNFLEKQGKK
jgi:hypothetical protein